MDWDKAKEVIKQNISIGTELNTGRSTLRHVVKANHKLSKYDYRGEEGFLVRISKHDSNHLEIPWSMLENCYRFLKEADGYSGKVFRQLYPRQAKDHPCHVHVVGMLYKKAGIAYSDAKEKEYYFNEK